MALAWSQLRTTGSTPLLEVQGVLIQVDGTGFGAPSQVVLRDDEGRDWTFDVDPEVATNREEPQSAGHLRQHMLYGELMLVRYRVQSDRLIALRIRDVQSP